VEVTVFSRCRRWMRWAERGAGRVMAGAPVAGGVGSGRLGECWAGCIVVSLVVVPGGAGLGVAGAAAAPLQLVPPSRAAGGFTTRSDLQDTHRTPTGTGPVPATCGNSPLDTAPAAPARRRPSRGEAQRRPRPARPGWG